MDLSELTPELFEKTEFPERRRGYDIDQVERFLEETGTAVAQLLARHRQIEERLAHTESLLREAEARAAAAEEATAAPAAPRATTGASEEQEIEQATSTLVMAKRTADATLAEARAEASGIVSEARAHAERVMADARAEADAELAEGRARVLEQVTALESRRDAVAAVVAAFESRIAEHRAQLTAVAERLSALVADPEALASHPEIVVSESAAGYTGDPGAASDPVDQPTEAYDTLGDERWGVGSWSSVVEATATPVESDRVGEAGGSDEMISLTDLEPSTGQTGDRFLRELDEAVNEGRDQGDEAIAAFLEPTDEPGRRFGWRR